MKDSVSPKPIYLKDYEVPVFLIDKTELDFNLQDTETIVSSRLTMRRNPECGNSSLKRLLFNGGEDLILLSITLDGQVLPDMDYQLSEESLELDIDLESFVLEIKTRIQPQNNTRLEGLYKSNGMYCTQCEAEGFRHITYYLDRPDVMSKFTTRIEANKNTYPILLSNGNKIDSGDSGEGRHWVSWEDPFKKPCYLFALVAGDLAVKEDHFITMSGRSVLMQLFVEPHDLDKCDHALLSLKNSMKWDEDVYGREYDLDIYMIVAVSHFNMGAMENKGLNIFNTSCVLANPETTTDMAFQRVEGVVAHEYFHNWSGNRVTCRDWFQLSLKEGFTVFRDEEFSADMGSRTVKRIEDVTFLKTVQFAEDAGPLAHPIRPESYIEMNNFYTTTVYNKGAEVVRMIHTLVGKDGFRKGTDLYFERFDGQAVTTDDFVSAMEEVNKIDLSQFKHWYSQAGTPHLSVSDSFDEKAGTYTLHVRQQTKPTPKQAEKAAFFIPLKTALLDNSGAELKLSLKSGNAVGSEQADGNELILLVDQFEQDFVFSNIPVKPTPSLLRGFSSPVTLEYNYSNDQLGLLMRHDSDGFIRWDAAQQLSKNCIFAQIENLQNGKPVVLEEALMEGFRDILSEKGLDKELVSKILTLPSEAYLVGLMQPANISAIHAVRQSLIVQLATGLKKYFLEAFKENISQLEYQPSAEQIAQRSLKNCCLQYLMTLTDESSQNECALQFSGANNMTDVAAALRAMVHNDAPQTEEALQLYYDKWKHEPLVIDQWFAIQASSPVENCLLKVKRLMEHPLFELTNPNKVRALIATFCSANLVNFHNSDGSGYEFLSEIVLKLDAINPQIAARIVNPLSRWRQQDDLRRELMVAALEKIKSEPNLSNDLYEMVSKSLE